MTFQRLTFRTGHFANARFAPDGQTAFYSASWDGNPRELFQARPRAGELSVGLRDANLLSVSRDGELAVLLPKVRRHPYHEFGTGDRVRQRRNAARDRGRRQRCRLLPMGNSSPLCARRAVCCSSSIRSARSGTGQREACSGRACSPMASASRSSRRKGTGSRSRSWTAPESGAEPGASVINISSGVTRLAPANTAVYSGTKGALDVITSVLRSG